MSMRTPLVLLIIAVGLLAYVLVFERGRPSAKEIESRSGLLVESLVRDRLTGIRIAFDDQRVVLRRQGEGFDETWTLEQPEKAAADPEAVEDYLRAWEFAIPIRIREEPTEADLQSFGLERPAAEVTFEMGRGNVRVGLGSGTPVQGAGSGYVRIGDDEAVAVVGDDVVALFKRTAESFEIKDDGGAFSLPELIDADAGTDASTPDL
ncbi:MAG: DUF4340 domain-containing protein [Myxococcales bacterium]